MMKGTVLITGAGSVGRAFIDLLKDDYAVTVVDENEWSLAELRDYPITRLLSDFRNVGGNWDFVIHTAAYKHVTLCEDNISSTIDNNLTATSEFYSQLDTKNLLYISTDKAVEPTSVYGASKMIAERLTWSKGWQVARSGNFLGSSGSVIPIWEQKIANNEVIPVTDIHMRRYVCDIEPAVKEIWDRFLQGERLIIPTVRDIGLLELLDEVLVKHGFSLETYEPGIEVIGMKKGEKLKEKLRWDNE